MKKIFILLLINACLLTKSISQDWINFTSAEGKFTVQFPNQPTQQLDSSTTYPRYTVNMFISKNNTDIVVLGWVDYESKYTFNEQSELEANRDNFIKGVNGTLSSSRNIEFKTYKGLEFVAQSEGIYWRSKVFMVGRRPYQLLIGSTTGKASENEDKFFNSFVIKND